MSVLSGLILKKIYELFVKKMKLYVCYFWVSVLGVSVHYVKARFYLNECSITFMKDWILRKVVLSTGRKFIPGKKNDIFIQSKRKLYF